MKRKLLFLTMLMLSFTMAGLSQDPVILTVTQPEPLLADAGTDTQITLGESVTLGGTPAASLGYESYIYLWSPAEGLDDPTLSNPVATPGETTTYTLTVTDANNCSTTDELIVTVGASGIEGITTDLKLVCYPNPVEDELLIELTGVISDLTIRLISPLGQEMMLIESRAGSHSASESIPMKDLPAGLYFIQVVSDETVIIQSIIKTR